MDKQEIFDKVAAHLLSQNEKAVDSAGITCMYRAPRGLKCAAGVLISEEFYSSALEGKAADHPAVLQALLQSGVNITDFGAPGLLFALQQIHDQKDPEIWREQLIDLARKHGLSASKIS